MLAALDGPLYALTRRLPDVLIPLIARQGEVRSVLIFTRADAARAHLERLPAGAEADWEVAGHAAGDWRAKEELLLAAAATGATRVELDPDLELRSRHTADLHRAVAYAASYKRATACL